MPTQKEIILVINLDAPEQSEPFPSMADVMRKYPIPRRQAYQTPFPIHWENLLILKKQLPRIKKPGNKPNLKR